MKNHSIIWLVLISFMVTACSKSDDERFVNKLSGPVLVKVNGSPVTQRDVDVAAIRMLGARRAFEVDSTGRQKILESIVLSKILTEAAVKEQNPESIDSINRQVRDYREELLIKEYLRKHIKPVPVTQAMIQDYYEKYPERFGGKTIREYMALTTSGKTAGKLRQQIFKAFSDAKIKKNWRAYAKKLSKQGMKVELKKGKTDDKLLHARLKMMLEAIKLNDTSKPFMLDGRQYVLRVTAEKKQKPRELKEVGAEIRKAIAPGILKAAINKVSEDLKVNAVIEYTKFE